MVMQNNNNDLLRIFIYIDIFVRRFRSKLFIAAKKNVVIGTVRARTRLRDSY